MVFIGNATRNFTNTADFIVIGGEESESVRRSLRSVSETSTSVASVLLPKDKCIFCNSCRKRKSGHEYEKLSQCMTLNAENAIKHIAQLKNDFRLLGLSSGVDLIAKEAMYHKTCYKSYVRGYEDVMPSPIPSTSACASDVSQAEGYSIEHRFASENPAASVTDIKTAQSQALSHVYNYVQQNIMQQGCVERMTMLRERYQLHVQENAPNCFDPNFRTSSLKQRLVTHFGEW